MRLQLEIMGGCGFLMSIWAAYVITLPFWLLRIIFWTRCLLDPPQTRVADAGNLLVCRYK